MSEIKNQQKRIDGPGEQEPINAFKNVDKQDVLGTFSGQTTLRWFQ